MHDPETLSTDAVTPTPAAPSAPPASLEPHVAGALAYLLGPITGILFLVVDRRPFVRFHAAQATALGVAWVALVVVLNVVEATLGVIPGVGLLVAVLGLFLWMALGVGFVGLWFWLMVQAFRGHGWEIPVLGAHVRRHFPAGEATVG